MAKRSRRKRAARVVAALPPPEARVQRRDYREEAIAGGLLVGAAILYAQLRTHLFINFDDPVYIVRNPHVLAGLTWEGVRWAFTTFYASNWHPVTWLSHMLDVTLFGRDAGKHLLMSATLHAFNAVLLFLWLRRATNAVWRPAIVAALFAVHPLHVESVAWASERKDTLSAFFFLMTLLLYTQYVQMRSRAAFIASMISFALGLLSKPMLVTVPFLLLLIDYWPLQRANDENLANIRRLIFEKVGFFAAIVPSIVLTLRAQHEAMPTFEAVPIAVRLANAATSCVAYLVKTTWPAKLSILYPYQSPDSRWTLICVVLLLGVTLAAIRWRRSSPWLFVGWCWFIGSLVPVIGVIQVGLQSMADRYTYIPHIGLFIAIVWSSSDVARSATARRILVAATIGALIVLGSVTYVQIGYWANTRTLFEHALAVTHNNSLAHVTLAGELLEEGDYVAAEREYRLGQSFRPAEVVHIGLADSLAGQGRLDEAAAEALRSVQANPNNAEALATVGTIELSRGRTAEAQQYLRRSVEKSPEPDVLAKLAFLRGDLAGAKREFQRAIGSRPDDGSLHNELAAVLAKRGEGEQAMNEYRAALRFNPNLYDAHMNYGALLSRVGREPEAMHEFEEAIRLRPGSPEPYVYLALVEANQHRFAEAATNISRAIAIDRDESNRFLTQAIRIPPDPMNIDRYWTFLRQQKQ